MQKFLRAFLCSLILMAFFTASAFAAPAIIFNGNTVKSDVPPIIEKGVTLVPFRVILENFGATVNYEHTTKKVNVYKDGLNINLKVGDKTAYVNDKGYTLLVPAKIYEARTLVPLRFISEALNAQVDWNNTTKTVTINYNVSQQPQQPTKISEYENEILKLVNETRKKNGLKELVWVGALADVARAHSKDMADNGYFDHVSPTAGSPSDRAISVGLPGVGENIAAGPLTPAAVHEAWMNSPGHRANILNADYRFIGVGFYQSSKTDDIYGGKYFTQNFIAGDTFFSLPKNNTTVESTKINISGYSTISSPKVTIYKMIDDKTFSESYEVTLKVVNGKFSQDVELKLGKGKYSIWASGYDARVVTLK